MGKAGLQDHGNISIDGRAHVDMHGVQQEVGATLMGLLHARIRVVLKGLHAEIVDLQPVQAMRIAVVRRLVPHPDLPQILITAHLLRLRE